VEEEQGRHVDGVMSASQDGSNLRAARRSFLRFAPPLIGEDEIAEVLDTLRSGWITTGRKVREFEERFAELTGGRKTLAFNSWTAAAHAALFAHGIGPGDEVIVPTLTFVATANVVEHVGATPVFVDVQPDTLNIDPADIRRKLTPATKAIIPVHYAGHPADMDEINEIASERGLLVLEDAAHAFPAKYRDRPIGSGSNCVAFSFYATKNITTGEGGMLIAEPKVIERARSFSLHGMSRGAWGRYDEGGSWEYDVAAPGFKFNMTDIQASLGLAQLRKVHEMQARRAELVAIYNEGLDGLAALTLPSTRSYVDPALHLYVVRLHASAPVTRNEFIAELQRRKIGTGVHFIPVHRHSYYRNTYGLEAADYPVAEEAFSKIVSLPLSPALVDDDIRDVVHAVRAIVR
jgi:dTDP-4-amino-4,6-dideoxygalactose transaminase